MYISMYELMKEKDGYFLLKIHSGERINVASFIKFMDKSGYRINVLTDEE